MLLNVAVIHDGISQNQLITDLQHQMELWRSDRNMVTAVLAHRLSRLLVPIIASVHNGFTDYWCCRSVAMHWSQIDIVTLGWPLTTSRFNFPYEKFISKVTSHSRSTRPGHPSVGSTISTSTWEVMVTGCRYGSCLVVGKTVKMCYIWVLKYANNI